LYDGRRSNEKYRKDKGDVPVYARKFGDETTVVLRKDVKTYLEDPEFIVALEYYNYTKLWGLPNGAGWVNEPCDLLEAITALELESKTIEQESLEKHERDTGKSTPKG
jgi:hypothetical protein